jgi:transposase
MVRRVRAISNEEGQKLARLCRHPSDAIELHRAMVILSSAQGFTPPYIARLVGYSPDWVRTLIREFNLHGFKMLKPNSKAGGNWKFTQEQKDQLVALATSRPRDLGLPFSQWSLARLRDEARNQRIVDSISLEWLRIVLDEADMSHQSIKTWKKSSDPKFEEKRCRIDRLTHKKTNPPIVLSMDEIGPIQLMPHGGQGWFRSGHPERIPSTYKRLKGTRYLYLTLNVYHQRLSGRFYQHKGGVPWLDYLEREIGKYPPAERIYLIQDNLSAHWTPEIRAWAREHRVTLVASATQASWMNPVESHAGDLQKLVMDGSNFSSWAEIRREFGRAIAYRNRERVLRKKRFRDTQMRRWVAHRRPIWKRH